MPDLVTGDAHGVGQEPADGHRHPDARDADGGNGREAVGQGHPGAQGNHGQHHRHARAADGPVIAVEQEQQTDQAVEAALDSEIRLPDVQNFRLSGLDENAHQRPGQQEHRGGDEQAEDRGGQNGASDAVADSLPLLRAEVLGDKGGKGVAEVLDRHIGEGVDLHRGGKGRHDRRAEGVDPALDHQNAEIHHRLLDRRQGREPQNLRHIAPVVAQILPPDSDLRAANPAVDPQPQTGDVLGDDRGCRRARHAPVKRQDEDQVQADIEDRRHGQKQQRGHGIAQGPEQTGEEVIEERGGDAEKDHKEIRGHQAPAFIGHLEQRQNGLEENKDQHIEHGRHQGDEAEGEDDAPAQPLPLPLAPADGEEHAAAHGQAQEDGGQKRHQRIGRAHRPQGVAAQIPAHNQRVGDVIALLEQVAHHKGPGEPQQRRGNGPPGQISAHSPSPPFRVSRSI